VIISKTPLRISFLGGGTDYPEYFTRHGGAVLGSAIDKFAYVSVSKFYSRLFDYSIRISYRQVECVRDLSEIQHAPFRECLRWCGITKDVEVNYSAELPAFTGLGSSSAFVVGLLHALHAFRGRSTRGLELAYEAIRVEREVLRESVGCQDQAFAALGGLNLIEFRSPQDLVVHRVPISPDRQQELEAHLLVAYTGMQRRAGDITSVQIRRTDENAEVLHAMRGLVDDGYRELTGDGSLERFGRILHDSWLLKCKLEDRIANDHIRSLYGRGLAAGAFGGKLLGAGGGGFLLFVVPPERRAAVREVLGRPQELDIKLNAAGSHIITS
jgi:D-glycero-alpha-D-manno-heptose-7-phosphate kinase